MKKIVVLTGSELRHTYFRKRLAFFDGVHVLKTYCESAENILQKGAVQDSSDKRKKHLLAREQSEKDFFTLFVEHTPDHSNPLFLDRGKLITSCIKDELIELNPEIIVVYGASIITEPLLSAFTNRIINVHLGLSPYFRGSATNFWPFAENLPECIGATFMYIGAGIDTGEIIHQIRPEITFFDTPSTIGNRLIVQMTGVIHKLITNFGNLKKMLPPDFNSFRRFCRKKDYTEEAVELVYENFSNGMIEKYLECKLQRDNNFPLVVNPIISEG